MRLTSEQFWRLTMRQFVGLCERLRADHKADDYRFGMIAATIANSVRSRRQRAYKPTDFFPNLKRRQTPRDHANILQAMAAAWAAKEKAGNG